MSSPCLDEGVGLPPSQSEHIIWQQEQCGALSQKDFQELFSPQTSADNALVREVPIFWVQPVGDHQKTARPKPPPAGVDHQLQLTMPGAGSSNFCGCTPLLTTKKQGGQSHPQLVLTTKKQWGQRIENRIKPHRTDYKTDWQNIQNRQNRTLL